MNEKSDIYSFGVVILELVTGKPPIDSEYGEEDLVKWVSTTMNQKGMDQVIDPCLDSKYKEEMKKVLNVGLLCTSNLPITRPSMRRVVKMLQEACGHFVVYDQGDDKSDMSTDDDSDEDEDVEESDFSFILVKID